MLYLIYLMGVLVLGKFIYLMEDLMYYLSRRPRFIRNRYKGFYRFPIHFSFSQEFHEYRPGMFLDNDLLQLHVYLLISRIFAIPQLTALHFPTFVSLWNFIIIAFAVSGL